MKALEPITNRYASQSPAGLRRFTKFVASSTLFLIFAGAMVTSTGSGLAVPDWPNTYGYNLFLYPWTEWIAGPWDLFIEHAHRLFAATVGLVCIALVVVVWRTDSRRWMRIASPM